MSETGTADAEPKSVRVYTRTVGASLERVWENVRDWEHLPWLHSATFASIALVDESDSTWRADIEFTEALCGGQSQVEVVMCVDEHYYTTRTVSGEGAGTEIVTRLAAREDGATDIEVDFRVPGVALEDREFVGDAMQTVYARLWDEDESMMIERPAVVDERPDRSARPASGRLELGRHSRVREGLPLTLRVGSESYRLVEVTADGGAEVILFNARGPHRGGPLGQCEVKGGTAVCPWHGYAFNVTSGASSDGRGLRLGRAPRLHHDRATDMLTLVWD